jgi:hypothetical protein
VSDLAFLSPGRASAEAMWRSPLERALQGAPPDISVELLEKLSKDLFAIDVSASLAGLSVRGEAVMRRITDLDLDALPAAGAVSHVQAIVTRDGDSFALWFAQEYSDYLAEVVIDAHKGLHR